MENPSSVPASISHRQLQALLSQAPVEPGSVGEHAPADPALEEALATWSRSSQQLLQALQQSAPSLRGRCTPRQLMALGALQAHVAMGLQALASGLRPQD